MSKRTVNATIHRDYLIAHIEEFGERQQLLRLGEGFIASPEEIIKAIRADGREVFPADFTLSFPDAAEYDPDPNRPANFATSSQQEQGHA